MHAAVRRLWLRLHRWVALSLGLLLALQALVGSALVVLKPLDRAMNPQLFQAGSSAGSGTLEAARRALVGKFGPEVAFTLRPPREPGDTLWALVHAPQWDGTVYFDPASARELGRRGEHEGAFNLLFELHSSL